MLFAPCCGSCGKASKMPGKWGWESREPCLSEQWPSDPCAHHLPKLWGGRPGARQSQVGSSVEELWRGKAQGQQDLSPAGEFIIGRVIKAMNNNWHPGCFRCELCDVELADLGFVKNAGR